MWWFGGNFKPEGKTALIVGASQGLGVALAQNLYERGCSVILVARTGTKLKAKVDEITTKSKNAIPNCTASYIACDVSDYDSCTRLWDTIMDTNGQDPDYIFCCAGTSVPKLFADLTGEELGSGISINYSTALYTVHSGFKKALSKSSTPKLPSTFKPRHIVLFSSVLGFFPFIGYAQYGPMKAAILSFASIMRHELGPYNYRITCAYPGNFQSEGYEEEMKTKPRITSEIEGASVPISSDACAKKIISALDQGFDTITTDFIGWVLGCSVLGVLPKEWWFLQVIMSFIFSLVEPIASWFVYREVVRYFDELDPQKASKGSAIVDKADDVAVRTTEEEDSD